MTNKKLASAIIVLIKHIYGNENDLGKTLLGIQIVYQGFNIWYPINSKTGILRIIAKDAANLQPACSDSRQFYLSKEEYWLINNELETSVQYVQKQVFNMCRNI